MAKWICEDCELVFEGGPNAHLCPDCRRRRLSENAKRRNLGQIGREAYSKQQAELKAERQRSRRTDEE